MIAQQHRVPNFVYSDQKKISSKRFEKIDNEKVFFKSATKGHRFHPDCCE